MKKTLILIGLIAMVLISGCKSELSNCMGSCMEEQEYKYEYKGVYSWGFDIYTEETIINLTIKQEIRDNCYNECKTK